MEDNGFQINEASFQPNKLKEKKKKNQNPSTF